MSLKGARQDEVYMNKGEKMALRVLEMPRLKTRGGVTYVNVGQLVVNHTSRDSMGNFRKDGCSNPYGQPDKGCGLCDRNISKSREYDVEVQVFWGENGRLDGDNHRDRRKYDSSTAYPMRMQTSLAGAIGKKFVSMMDVLKLNEDDYKYIVWTVEKLPGAPYYEVLDAVLDKTTPLPSYGRVAKDANTERHVSQGYQDSGAVGTAKPGAFKFQPKTVQAATIKWGDFTPMEQSYIKDISGQIKELITGGESIEAQDVLDNMVLNGISDEKAEWALANVFDKDWNFIIADGE